MDQVSENSAYIQQLPFKSLNRMQVSIFQFSQNISTFFVVLHIKMKKYSIDIFNLSVASETTSSDASGKERVSQSFTCFKALIRVIPKKSLKKIYQISSRMINMLHHKILHGLNDQHFSKGTPPIRCQLGKAMSYIREQSTCRRGNFQTALTLSREAAPSGQSNLTPRLKYFSARRLQNSIN